MRTSLLLATLASASLYACAARHDTPTQREPQASNYPPPVSQPHDDAMDDADADGHASNDAEVLAYLTALDQHEIKAAHDALQKQLPPAVQDYAQMMVDQHGQHLEATRQVGETIGLQPLETQDVDAFADRAMRKREELAALDGQAFADAYLSAMVEGHAEALEMIDDELEVAASNATLKQHLADTRTAVAMHLDHARRIQGGYDGQADAKPEGQIPPVGEADDNKDVENAEGTHPLVHEGKDDE